MEECPLCAWLDCECKDILTPEQYAELVRKQLKAEEETEWVKK